jgi:hypothetical protein
MCSPFMKSYVETAKDIYDDMWRIMHFFFFGSNWFVSALGKKISWGSEYIVFLDRGLKILERNSIAVSTVVCLHFYLRPSLRVLM